MKTIFTKKELIEAIKDYNDNNQVIINVHDTVLDEDNYRFYLDPIHMGLDSETNKDRGHQLWFCPIPHPVNKKELDYMIKDRIEKLKYYYEIDLNNCTMTHEMWIKELSKAMSDVNYCEKFNKEYNEYKKAREE